MKEIYIGKGKPSIIATEMKRHYMCRFLLFNEEVQRKVIRKIGFCLLHFQMAFDMLVYFGVYTPAGVKAKKPVYKLRALSMAVPPYGKLEN